MSAGFSLPEPYSFSAGPFQGGMGSVWRVRHRGWGTDLAMKRPLPGLFVTQGDRDNFVRECQNWIELGLHPNIVSCYYVREIGGVPSIFSEWMDNGNLRDRITDGAVYAGTETQVRARLLDIAIQYARGLFYAHESGLIHQDVKPDNLLLTRDWQAKAADFGLARARGTLTAGEGGDENTTRFAASGGYTPAYCSMEQMDGKILSRTTDIYSWAVTVMELFLGSRPWVNGVVAGMDCRSYFPMARIPLSEDLREMLAWCMQTQPEKRPHDFALVVERLLDIYRKETGKNYPRPEPKAVRDTAGSLNNRALSFLDLNQPARAEAEWQRAMMEDIYHAESMYNLSMYRWRKETFKDRYDREEKEEQLKSRLQTLKINGEKRYGQAVELALREIGGGEQAPFILSKILNADTARNREEEWQALCRNMRSCLDAGRIPEALNILERMRGMEGYAYNREYQLLASEAARFCQKKSLRGVRRSVIYFPVKAVDADISDDGTVIACNNDGVQIYDAWKGSASSHFDQTGDGRTVNNRSRDIQAGAGGEGRLYTMAHGNHFGIGNTRTVLDIVRVWNPENGRCQKRLKTTVNTELTMFRVSDDGALVIGVDGGKYQVFAWDGSEAKPRIRWNAHRDPCVMDSHILRFEAADISPDKRLAVLGGMRYESHFSEGTGAAVIWDMEGGSPTVQLPVTYRPVFCRWTPDMRHILMSGRAMAGNHSALIPEGIQVIDAEKLRTEREIGEAGNSALCADITRDGSWVFASMGKIRSHQELRDVCLPHRERNTWSLQVFDYQSGRKVHELEAPPLRKVKLFRGDSFVFGFESSTAYLWFLDWELSCGKASSGMAEHGEAETVYSPSESAENRTVYDPAEESGMETVYAPADTDGNRTVHAPADTDENRTVYAPAEESGMETVYAPADTDGNRTVHAPAEESGMETVYAPADTDENRTVHAPAEESSMETVYAPADTDGNRTVYAPAEESGMETVYAPSDTDENRTVYAPAEESGMETVYAPADTDGNRTVHDPAEENGNETVCSADVYETQEAGTETEDKTGTAQGDMPEYSKGSVLLSTYRIDADPIKGGMGSVWRVRHLQWNMDLAMKRPLPGMFSGEESKQNFVNECQSWIRLGLHPNIVSCFYVREIEGVPSIFSEWMENGSLESRIRDGRLYTGEEAEVKQRLLDIAIQFARGLHYAHENGMIHQDVKPDNLLLTQDWQAKVADFGLVRARGMLTALESSQNGKTHMAAAGGYTPAYCSMEQMDGKVLTRRTDVYSWAVSIMEMYLGSCPWANGVVAGMSCRSYMQECRVRMPERLRDLLESCMQMEAEKRPHDFASVGKQLMEIYREETGQEYPRPEPEAAADTPDSLNNRALSYLDLGMPELAGQYWDQVLEKTPDHALSVYNRGLHALREKTGGSGYSILDTLHQMAGDIYMSDQRTPSEEKSILMSRLSCAQYEGEAALMEMEQAVMRCRTGPGKTRMEEEKARVRQAFLQLPVNPGKCHRICFDADGRYCVTAWTEEGMQYQETEGMAGFIAVYDLKQAKELKRKNLHACGVSTLFDRVQLDGHIVYLTSSAVPGVMAAFETATLNRRPDMEEDFPGADCTDGWPYVETSDGLRKVQKTSYVERRGNRGVTVVRNDPATLWLDSERPARRGGGFLGGPPTPDAERNGLKAAIPAVGMDSGQYTVGISSDRNWLLVYYKPYYNDQKRYFAVLDTRVFGLLPGYSMARAVAFSEASEKQNEQEQLLRKASACLESGDVRGGLDALDRAYALSPENPGDRWTRLNAAAGRLPETVRGELRGSRQGRTLKEQEMDTDPRHEESYPLQSQSWEQHMGQQARDAVESRADVQSLSFVREGKGCRCLLRNGRQAAFLKGVQLPEDAAGAYDAGRRVVYICAMGLFAAWSAEEPARYLGAVRYGAAPAAGKLPPLRPWETNTLWQLVPEQVTLGRNEQASVALVWSRVLNPYGDEALTGFSSVTVIDLRTLHILHTFFMHEEKLVNIQEHGMTIAGDTLKDISADGELFLWFTVRGGVLWSIAGPDEFRTHIVGMTAECIRRDGNAVANVTSWSRNGNTYQEVLLDWQYKVGEKKPEFRWADALPEEQCLRAFGPATPDADGLDGLLEALAQTARSRMKPQEDISGEADPFADLLAGLEQRARDRLKDSES